MIEDHKQNNIKKYLLSMTGKEQDIKLYHIGVIFKNITGYQLQQNSYCWTNMDKKDRFLELSNHSVEESSSQHHAYNQSSIYSQQIQDQQKINDNLSRNLAKPSNTNLSKHEVYKIKSGELDYDKGVGEYLDNINKMFESSHGIQNKSISKEDEAEVEDREINNIIKQVMDKRKKMSRLSNANSSCRDQNQQMIKKVSYETQIQSVNARLQLQNEEMNKKIAKLLKKIKKFDNLSSFNKSANSTNRNINSSKSISTHKLVHNPSLMQTKQKELQKLRKRLQNAEKANQRMESELSKLYQSRKSSKNTLKIALNNQKKQKTQNPKYDIKVSCPNCEKTSTNTLKNSKKQQKIIISNANSPFRKDYYSPIMQFQEYSLKNEQTISLYDDSLQKTSQFGFQLIPSQPKSDKQVQVKSNGENEREQRELDEQILRLQGIINKNNRSISNYESLLLKQII